MKKLYSKKLYSIILIWIVLMLVFSCRKETPQPPPPPPKTIPSTGTVIFIDTSRSIMGYFRTSSSRATTIQQFLQRELRDIISEENLYPIYLSHFATEIENPEQIKGNIGNKFVFDSNKELEQTFDGVSTNLIGTFRTEDFGKYIVSIIITDGIQADPEGFDIGEMLRAIRAKISEGLHFYLLGIKSEFNGYIYPEKPDQWGHKKPFFDSISRPIYIWIASHDADTGRNLTGKIVTKLSSIAGSPDSVKVAGVTSVQPPDVNIKLDIDSSSSPIKSKQMDNQFEWLVARTRDEVIKVPVNIEISEDTVQTHLDFEWDINLELEPKSIRWAKVIKDDEGWTLNLTYALIPGNGFMSGCSSSKGNLKVVAKAIPKINPEKWWQQWSTEDDSLEQNAGRTLYLGRLSQIIEEPLRKNYLAGEVFLKVKKP